MHYLINRSYRIMKHVRLGERNVTEATLNIMVLKVGLSHTDIKWRENLSPCCKNAW